MQFLILYKLFSDQISNKNVSEMDFDTFQRICGADISRFLSDIDESRLEIQRLQMVADLPKTEAKAELCKSILLKAEIVFCTLSSAGGPEMRKLMANANMDENDELFHHCIIDEAGQCTEPDALVPLIHDMKSVVLVGDPQQLPATVFSQGPCAWLYQQSLFERFMRAGYPVHLLDTQYRMHPSIAQFPSVHFYNNKLKTAVELQSACMKSFHTHESTEFQPFLFFNLQTSRESTIQHSKKNEREAVFIVQHLISFVFCKIC